MAKNDDGNQESDPLAGLRGLIDSVDNEVAKKCAARCWKQIKRILVDSGPDLDE